MKRKKIIKLFAVLLIGTFAGMLLTYYASINAKEASTKDAGEATNIVSEEAAEESPVEEIKETTENVEPLEDVPAEEEDEVLKKLSEMTLEEKIYQMFIVTPEWLGYESGKELTREAVLEALQVHPVGGVIYFQYCLESEEQTRNMLKVTYDAGMEANGLPLFLSIDEEGGNTTRIAENEAFSVDNVGPMSEISSEEAAYKAGEYIGGYLKDFGFNLDFAPDSDVITNPENGIIGSRSFGTDPELVTRLSVAYSNGLHSQDILSTFKHFPGHGATKGDSHEGYALTEATYEDLWNADMVPFKAAEENDVDFVMVAHISVPEILGDNTPCTLSPQMVTETLRNKIGYQGIIITDALNMGAIVQNYGNGEAAVLAVLAGNDVLLMCPDIDEACEAIKEAVESGRIPEEMIDSAVERILNTKLNKLMK